jgi:hypothetical protein
MKNGARGGSARLYPSSRHLGGWSRRIVNSRPALCIYSEILLTTTKKILNQIIKGSPFAMISYTDLQIQTGSHGTVRNRAFSTVLCVSFHVGKRMTDVIIPVAVEEPRCYRIYLHINIHFIYRNIYNINIKKGVFSSRFWKAGAQDSVTAADVGITHPITPRKSRRASCACGIEKWAVWPHFIAPCSGLRSRENCIALP